jgi:hypothetical protein
MASSGGCSSTLVKRGSGWVRVADLIVTPDHRVAHLVAAEGET